MHNLTILGFFMEAGASSSFSASKIWRHRFRRHPKNQPRPLFPTFVKLVFICCVMGAQNTRGQVYDAVSDFTGSNPSGNWSYLGSTSVGGSLTGLSYLVSQNSQTSGLFNGQGIPTSISVLRNFGPGTTSYNSGGTIQPVNLLALDPESGLIDVRWTAPVTSEYSVKGLFQPLDLDTKPLEIQVIQNLGRTNQYALLSDTLGDPTYGEQTPFSFSEYVNAGQTIDFVVNSTGGFSYLGTGLSATIIGVNLGLSNPGVIQSGSLVISQSGTNVILTWPTNAIGFVLQSTTNLSAAAWTNASPAPVVINGQFTVTNAISVAQQFYQLVSLATTSQTAISAPMTLVPAGSFTMGDNLDGEGDASNVVIYVSAFYMDVALVTLSQWQSVFNWATNQGYSFDYDGSGKAGNHPVQTVNWYDCVKWCNALSQQAALTPVYYTDAALTQVYTNGDVDITSANVNWSANGYRLPTEAEWEKAARGGLSGSRFPSGLTISESQANYTACTACASWDLGPTGPNAAFVSGGVPYTSPVGYFAPNGYGLYDMAGNVYEWCWDWWGTPYGQPTTNNPTGQPSGTTRIVRGGDWNDSAGNAKCAERFFEVPSRVSFFVGFRCVRNY